MTAADINILLKRACGVKVVSKRVYRREGNGSSEREDCSCKGGSS